MPEVRLVGAAGEQVGIVGIEDALRMAMEADLDLVEVAPEAKPPVCKIMDYGKFKYEAAVKAREARKNQVNTFIKEMKLRPKIDQHDYETKKGHIERFLSQGDKVKITIMFRGREITYADQGFKMMRQLADQVKDIASVDAHPKLEGKKLIMILSPGASKSKAPIVIGGGPRPNVVASRGPVPNSGPTPHSGPTPSAGPTPNVVPTSHVGPTPNVIPVSHATPSESGSGSQGNSES